MQNVPKIVRERLKAPAGSHSQAHPDANVLTAFAEQSLAEGERAVILDHLARCGDCRDVVALALPAMEPVEAPVRAHAPGWVTWPVLRWGFATAGILAIAALGIVQYQRGVRSQSMASNPPARFEVAAKEAKNPPATPIPAGTSKKADNVQSPSAPDLVDSVEAKNARVNDTTSVSHAEARPADVLRQGILGRSAAGAVGGAFPHGPRMANQWQQNGLQNQVAAPAASSPFAKQQAPGDQSAKMEVPAASEAVTVEGRAVQLDTEAQKEARPMNSRSINDQPPAPPAGQDDDLARVGKAKPALPAPPSRNDALAYTVAAPAAPHEVSEASVLASSVPRWTISSTGGLQRSYDQGTTWQAVNVNTNPASFADATSLQISEKTSRANDRSRAKDRKMPPPIFRAVAATGVDVWAGGSKGALYHSLDAGDHWTRVMPVSAGMVLTGDVVSLEFPDLQHGKVSTSVSEVWTTSDAGQTWQKQ
jgi:hypothetical protein